MGLSYSYEIITAESDVDRLPEAVADLLTADSERIQRNGRERAVPLTFNFPADGALWRYAGDPAGSAADSVRVGSVYTSLRMGRRFAVLRATAATTDMSLLFEESPSVRRTFCTLGQTAGAVSVLLDREDEHDIQVWPECRSFAVPGNLSDVPESDIDNYCESILAAVAGEHHRPPEWPSWEERWLTRDREFYSSLGRERAGIPCRIPNCGRGSIEHGVLCRVHHFEQIRGRKCPFGD